MGPSGAWANRGVPEMKRAAIQAKRIGVVASMKSEKRQPLAKYAQGKPHSKSREYLIRRQKGGRRCRAGSTTESLWFALERTERAMSVKPGTLKPLHAPKAPHEDPVFLESTPARPLRI